jgi:hypothetical protein
VLSSFDFISGSRNLGDGDRAGGLPSDRDLTLGSLDGDFEAALRSIIGFLSSPDSCLGKTSPFNWLLSIFGARCDM